MLWKHETRYSVMSVCHRATLDWSWLYYCISWLFSRSHSTTRSLFASCALVPSECNLICIYFIENVEENYGRFSPQFLALQQELLPGFNLTTQAITARLQERQSPPTITIEWRNRVETIEEFDWSKRGHVLTSDETHIGRTSWSLYIYISCNMHRVHHNICLFCRSYWSQRHIRSYHEGDSSDRMVHWHRLG
jgi:hypothetical protein